VVKKSQKGALKAAKPVAVSAVVEAPVVSHIPITPAYEPVLAPAVAAPAVEKAHSPTVNSVKPDLESELDLLAAALAAPAATSAVVAPSIESPSVQAPSEVLSSTPVELAPSPAVAVIPADTLVQDSAEQRATAEAAAVPAQDSILDQMMPSHAPSDIPHAAATSAVLADAPASPKPPQSPTLVPSPRVAPAAVLDATPSVPVQPLKAQSKRSKRKKGGAALPATTAAAVEPSFETVEAEPVDTESAAIPSQIAALNPPDLAVSAAETVHSKPEPDAISSAPAAVVLIAADEVKQPELPQVSEQLTEPVVSAEPSASPGSLDHHQDLFVHEETKVRTCSSDSVAIAHIPTPRDHDLEQEPEPVTLADPVARAESPLFSAVKLRTDSTASTVSNGDAEAGSPAVPTSVRVSSSDSGEEVSAIFASSAPTTSGIPVLVAPKKPKQVLAVTNS